MTPREQQIVRALANSVRVLTVTQIARTWWSATRWGQSRAAASLRGLAQEGWLHLQQVLARPIQQLTTPLLNWRPGDPSPELTELARTLHRRARADAKPVQVVFAARRAVTWFGRGRAPTIKLTQMTHDLHVSEIFLHYRQQGLADGCWTSEYRLTSDWPLRVRPDAVLQDEEGGVVQAVEYGGDYPPSRLAALHAGFARVGIAYAIW